MSVLYLCKVLAGTQAAKRLQWTTLKDSVEPVCMCTGSQASDWQGWANKGTPLQAAGGIEAAGMGSWALLDGQQHAACALQQR